MRRERRRDFLGRIYRTRRTHSKRKVTGNRHSKRKNLPNVLLVSLTTQQDALRFSGTILVEPDTTNQLHQPSVALVFQLTAVDKNFIKDKLGAISDDKMNDIWTAFDELAGRE